MQLHAIGKSAAMLVDELFDVVIAAGQSELVKQGVQIMGRGIHIAHPYCRLINETGMLPVSRFYYRALFTAHCLPLFPLHGCVKKTPAGAGVFVA